MLRYSKERKELLKIAEYSKALIVSDFGEEIPNSIQAEEKMDALSDKPVFCSTNAILSFFRQNTNFDLVECGNIIVKDVKQLQKLSNGRKVICLIRPSARFIGSKFSMLPWLSEEKTMQLIAEILGKSISYYNFDTETLCYVH